MKKKEERQVISPFSPDFNPTWELWKEFKKEQFKFTYKPIGEQMSLNELCELAEGDEEVAKLIIKQSITKGWRGLFHLKTIKVNPNGATKQQTVSGTATRESLNDLYNKRFGQAR